MLHLWSYPYTLKVNANPYFVLKSWAISYTSPVQNGCQCGFYGFSLWGMVLKDIYYRIRSRLLLEGANVYKNLDIDLRRISCVKFHAFLRWSKINKKIWCFQLLIIVRGSWVFPNPITNCRYIFSFFFFLQAAAKLQKLCLRAKKVIRASQYIPYSGLLLWGWNICGAMKIIFAI